MDVEGRKEVVTKDGSVFCLGDEVTVVAEKNLNDKMVTGFLTGIVRKYVSVLVQEYTLIVRCTAILGREEIK
jgi:hypothetical protein